MKLIIGLGNPGIKYQFSRHNIGFLALDTIASSHNIAVSLKGFDACFGKGKIGDIPVLLAKPQTFMNISGFAAKKFVDYFKIDHADIIVIHDDIDLPFETIRLKSGGGHAGHKGLLSIIDYLGDLEFIRVRLGIGKPLRKTMVEGYVLQPFNDDEMKLLPQITTRASDAVTMTILSGIQAAMNQYNDRSTNLRNGGDDTLSC
ncbi:MAG: aminoacyl-tRNA hydrolase [Deltaproteobacteria bacterium]|nr:aminoacyl-tRNA hydrolase [Deltaproteobacteria bacterium]